MGSVGAHLSSDQRTGDWTVPLMFNLSQRPSRTAQPCSRRAPVMLGLHFPLLLWDMRTKSKI